MYFRDDNCTDVRKDVTKIAFASSIETAKAASKYGEESLMNLFGPDAVSKITPQNFVSAISRAADSGTWIIQASCYSPDDTSSEAKCNDQFLYGGNSSVLNLSNPSSGNLARRGGPSDVNMLFCKNIFRMPSLNA
jgi:hypothetical protein